MVGVSTVGWQRVNFEETGARRLCDSMFELCAGGDPANGGSRHGQTDGRRADGTVCDLSPVCACARDRGPSLCACTYVHVRRVRWKGVTRDRVLNIHTVNAALDGLGRGG